MRTMKNKKFTAAAIASAMITAAPRLANACATCGLADGDQALHAYKTSVVFMLASPYAAFIAIGGVTYFFYRRSTRQDPNSDTK
ncbi:MAG: hypothetical protein WAU82_11920 [Candidatus Binatus sp.]